MKRGGLKREGELLKEGGGGVIREMGLFERGA